MISDPAVLIGGRPNRTAEAHEGFLTANRPGNFGHLLGSRSAILLGLQRVNSPVMTAAETQVWGPRNQ